MDEPLWTPRQPTPEGGPRLSNSRLDTAAVSVSVLWNDKEILTRAGTAMGNEPEFGKAPHVHAITSLFKHYNLPCPTYWALTKWVREMDIPDRWRPTLIYMLMLHKAITTPALFRRAATPASEVTRNSPAAHDPTP